MFVLSEVIPRLSHQAGLSTVVSMETFHQYVHIYIYIYMCVYIYIYIYIHTLQSERERESSDIKPPMSQSLSCEAGNPRYSCISSFALVFFYMVRCWSFDLVPPFLRPRRSHTPLRFRSPPPRSLQLLFSKSISKINVRSSSYGLFLDCGKHEYLCGQYTLFNRIYTHQPLGRTPFLRHI